MASKHLSLLSLLLVISSLHVHARDSQFFSKVTPNNNNNVVDEAKNTRELTPQREEELPRFTQESRNGYGLYGHDEIHNSQFNEVPYGASSSSNLPVGGEKFESNNNNENWQFRESGYKVRQNNLPHDNFYNNNNNNNNNYDGYKSEEFNNNNNNGYKGSSNNNNYNEFRNEEFNNNNYNNAYKGEQFNNNNNNNMYPSEKQGMSDTRFLEHGRYFYDPHNDVPTPNREFGSRATGNRGVEYSRNQYYNGGFNNGNSRNNNNDIDEFDP